MLIIALLKGVPARTTQVVQVGGVLNREAMDLVLNPHDAKAIEAADFVKRRVGGKIIALSMGPDVKLAPIMKPLYDAEVFGVDEECILSDRKMAGADTLATSYAVALGVKKSIERHTKPIDELVEAIKKGGYSDIVRAKAAELYRASLLSNRVYSDLPVVRDSVVSSFLDGRLTAQEALSELQAEKERISKFIILSGIKTTDGETGSVGPQVSEGLSELVGRTVPHSTYVDDFDIDPTTLLVDSERKLGFLSQRLVMELPALLTVSTEYRPRPPTASDQAEVRKNNYHGKVLQPIKWTADDLSADPQRLGFAGSPTIVGPGIDIGKPPVQKIVGKSLVFLAHSDDIEFDGKKYGPFDRCDLADDLPQGLKDKFSESGLVGPFTYEMLKEDILK
jgi:electron transfer flavoprotein beta subunit